MSDNKSVHATFYLTCKPTIRSGRVTGLRAEKLAQGPPRSPQPATVTVKLTVGIPVSVFDPLVAEVEFTPNLVQLNPDVTIEGEEIA